MDEAAAKLRMERDSVPEELDDITRQLKQLEIEREAIRRENDEQKIQQLDKEIAELLHIKPDTSKSQFRYAKSLLAIKIKQFIEHERER